MDRADLLILCDDDFDWIAGLQRLINRRMFAEGDQDARTVCGFDDDQFSRQQDDLAAHRRLRSGRNRLGRRLGRQQNHGDDAQPQPVSTQREQAGRAFVCAVR